jgi:hypothetical protein
MIQDKKGSLMARLSIFVDIQCKISSHGLREYFVELESNLWLQI